MPRVEAIHLKDAPGVPVYVVRLKQKIIGGAHDFEAVPFKAKSWGRDVKLYMVGIGPEHCIPHTEHFKKGRLVDMPLKMFDVMGKKSLLGTVKRVLKAETVHDGEVVIKIPLKDGTHLSPRQVEENARKNQLIAKLVPAAKLLRIVWLQGLNYNNRQTENPHGIMVEFHEHVNDKNLAQEHLGENDFVKAFGEIARSTLTLFKNNLVYYDMKPENFCRDKRTHEVKIVDKNSVPWRFSKVKGLDTPLSDQRNAERIGKCLAACFFQLHQSNFNISEKLAERKETKDKSDRALREGLKAFRKELNSAKMKGPEAKFISESFESALAKMLRDEETPGIESFGQ